jgi:hypothetical protein
MCEFGLRLHLTKGAHSHLKGLKHVEIHFEIEAYYMFSPSVFDGLNEMEMFLQGHTFDWLSAIGIESLRFVVEMKGIAPTEDFKTSILKVMQRREDEILSK